MQRMGCTNEHLEASFGVIDSFRRGKVQGDNRIPNAAGAERVLVRGIVVCAV